MKHIIPLLLVSLCLVACEQKERKAISVANKTFYFHSTQLSYYKFTTDSVFHCLNAHIEKGTYVQQNEIVKMKLEGKSGFDYGILNDYLITINGSVYTLEMPNN